MSGDLGIVNPPSLGAPRGYANGVLAPAGSRLLMVAGQIAWDGDQRIVSDDFTAQFAQALRNVVAVVEAAGGGAEHLGSLTLYVTDKGEYLAATREVGTAYREICGRHFPAMALVEVRGLLDPRAKVEIQGLAALPAAPSGDA
ncbi:MAG: RidA family protein [Acidobacteriota bacterium]